MALLFGCFPAVEGVLAARLARFAFAAVGVMEIIDIKEKPKSHVLMHVPQFIAYMDHPLGMTSKHANTRAKTRCTKVIAPVARRLSTIHSVFCNE